MSDSPARVTVLIPARDEGADLEACLAAIAAQDLALEEIDVIVVDGASSDGTVAIAEAFLAAVPFHDSVVIVNPGATTPSNLNVGLSAVRTPYVCRVDARSIIPPDYVRRCVELLATRPDVAVTGGAQVAVARDETARAVGIARALNNSMGMGFSRYRRDAPAGPADTVYLGAFRTEELRSIGGWDERFTTNQDFDLNRRIAATGAVWYESGLPVRYVPRARVGDIFRQYHRFGRWKVRYWRWRGERPRPRQLVILSVPPVGVLAGLVWSRGRPARLLALVAAGIGLAVVVEQIGRPRPGRPSGPMGTAFSVGTLVAVWVGWLSGVGREALHRAQRSDPVAGPSAPVAVVEAVPRTRPEAEPAAR